MADFNVRSESVDVEQIMGQIRGRIKEKRGVDYTEEQVRELATVRLEKFLDPKNLRSDLLEEFRRSRPTLPEINLNPPPVEPPFEFDDKALFTSHRGPLRLIRRLLKPVLMLFFNPNRLNSILHSQAQFNIDMLKRDQRRKIEMQMFDRSRAEWNVLYYEVLHNLVVETTRNGIELKNLKMRVEALASRLDFSERRVRALEGVVQYRPEAVRHRPAGSGRPEADRARPARDGDGDGASDTPAPAGEQPQAGGAGQVTPGEGRRRRRRRRGRRVFGTGTEAAANGEQAPPVEDPQFSDDEGMAADEPAADADDEPDAQ